MRAGALPTLLAGTALLAALTGCTGSPAAGSPGSAPPRATPSPVRDPAADSFKSVRTYDEVAVPVRLRIPAAGVDTPLERLGRAPDRSIALPSRPELAGWFSGGPRPGQPGPAVIIGHVDWGHRPAVFFRLAGLGRGDDVLVDRADGSTVRFRMVRLQQVPKTDFPTDQVYGPDLAPSLRLITCGGSFDRSTRNYRDNVIVYAAPA
ncbi:MAG: class F sortase [Mycobacteriales bacterium]